MVFLSFLNLGLVVLYSIFAAYMAIPVGWTESGGIALATLILALDYGLGKRPLSWVYFGVVSVAATACLILYSFLKIGDANPLGGFNALLGGSTVVTVLGAICFVVASSIEADNGLEDENLFQFKVLSFWVVPICATLANCTLLLAVFYNMLFAV